MRNGSQSTNYENWFHKTETLTTYPNLQLPQLPNHKTQATLYHQLPPLRRKRQKNQALVGNQHWQQTKSVAFAIIVNRSVKAPAWESITRVIFQFKVFNSALVLLYFRLVLRNSACSLIQLLFICFFRGQSFQKPK